MTRNLSQI